MGAAAVEGKALHLLFFVCFFGGGKGMGVDFIDGSICLVDGDWGVSRGGGKNLVCVGWLGGLLI